MLIGSKWSVHLLLEHPKPKTSKSKKAKWVVQQLLSEAILDVRTVQNLGIRANWKERRKYNEKEEWEQKN